VAVLAACSEPGPPALPEPPEGAELVLELGDLEFYKVFDGDLCPGTLRRMELQTLGLAEHFDMDPPRARVFLYDTAEAVGEVCRFPAGCAPWWGAHATPASVNHELVHVFVLAATGHARTRRSSRRASPCGWTGIGASPWTRRHFLVRHAGPVRAQNAAPDRRAASAHALCPARRCRALRPMKPVHPPPGATIPCARARGWRAPCGVRHHGRASRHGEGAARRLQRQPARRMDRRYSHTWHRRDAPARRAATAAVLAADPQPAAPPPRGSAGGRLQVFRLARARRLERPDPELRCVKPGQAGKFARPRSRMN
jgi:hypothetical protein